jgi:hypothetical protein
VSQSGKALRGRLGETLATNLLLIEVEGFVIPTDKATRKEKDAAMVPDDPRPEWAEEDNVIEDRKPDLGEIEEDTSEL